MFVNVEKVKPTLGIADEPDYGFCDATIGRLDMEDAKLESNLSAMLLKLSENRPKRKDKDDNSFITRCILKVHFYKQTSVGGGKVLVLTLPINILMA